ncbi:MAG TPA: TetR/AcrR family transcriptional regulator [Acidocella sp.]|jgi:AcrR family transcriptional regulator|uniref:TetR/AcrR family transcriptional regulator n=1 Tax=Acidocella sp. TaxID=50710 RepID=UPI002B74BCF4|nr:TetR/AcrR family transcriptional regulator [Acidocella sp.]HVE22304.1 TetR/AcrR family transcriptional regulator [Acidocella sp.]
MGKTLSASALNGTKCALASPQARILEVARELFCRDGIHATGIDRILSDAGASKMTLYARFGSKTGLLRAVLLEEGEEWRNRFFAQIGTVGTDPATQLRAIIPALKAWFSGERFYGCAFMNAVAEHQKGEPWLRELAAAHHRKILAELDNLAERAGYAEPPLLARQLLLLIDGTIAALMVSGDPLVLDIASRNLDAILSTAQRAGPGNDVRGDTSERIGPTNK